MNHQQREEAVLKMADVVFNLLLVKNIQVRRRHCPNHKPTTDPKKAHVKTSK